MAEDTNYAHEYDHAVAPRPSDTDTLLKSLDRTDRLGKLHPEADYTRRGVVADKLQEEGRDSEAELLRSPHPVEIRAAGGPGHVYQSVFGGHLHHNEGYPVYYTLPHLNPQHNQWGLQYVDNDPFCHSCANDTVEGDPLGTPLLEQHPHWEGPPIECTNCGAEIESAYGDPDHPDDPD